MLTLSAKAGVIRFRYPVEFQRGGRRELFYIWTDHDTPQWEPRQIATAKAARLPKPELGPWQIVVFDFDMIECDGERIERCHLADAIAIGAAVIHSESPGMKPGGSRPVLSGRLKSATQKGRLRIIESEPAGSDDGAGGGARLPSNKDE